MDAIAEFSVLTGNYSAEYGRTSGGVVNAISKSGTNAFHGDLYEFLRNDKLDANDYFSNASGQKKAALKRNQFGGAAGGPIRKDRTFIFGDYEGIRQSKGVSGVTYTVPSDNAGGRANPAERAPPRKRGPGLREVPGALSSRQRGGQRRQRGLHLCRGTSCNGKLLYRPSGSQDQR